MIKHPVCAYYVFFVEIKNLFAHSENIEQRAKFETIRKKKIELKFYNYLILLINYLINK